MEVEIGKVMHYYDHIQVAVLLLSGVVKLGDEIHIQGHATDFSQRIASIEVDHENILWAKPGDNVAIKVDQPVHVHDLVYTVIEQVAEPG